MEWAGGGFGARRKNFRISCGARLFCLQLSLQRTFSLPDSVSLLLAFWWKAWLWTCRRRAYWPSSLQASWARAWVSRRLYLRPSLVWARVWRLSAQPWRRVQALRRLFCARQRFGRPAQLSARRRTRRG